MRSGLPNRSKSRNGALPGELPEREPDTWLCSDEFQYKLGPLNYSFTTQAYRTESLRVGQQTANSPLSVRSLRVLALLLQGIDLKPFAIVSITRVRFPLRERLRGSERNSSKFAVRRRTCS